MKISFMKFYCENGCYIPDLISEFETNELLREDLIKGLMEKAKCKQCGGKFLSINITKEIGDAK